MRKSFPVQTKPMESRRRQFLEAKTHAAIRTNPRVADLERRLLALGGEIGLFEPESWWLEPILMRGTVFEGQSRQWQGEHGQCHYNSARLWAAAPKQRQLVTGYALGEDGCWRCHSWVLEPAKGKPPVVETTRKRLIYFGVVLTSEEADRFWRAEVE